MIGIPGFSLQHFVQKTVFRIVVIVAVATEAVPLEQHVVERLQRLLPSGAAAARVFDEKMAREADAVERQPDPLRHFHVKH